ncbi:DNA adenine methylase [Methanococcus sp. CF]
MSKLNAKPFLKWAGGKAGLLGQFKSHYPKKLLKNGITKYVEPFLGGGAVFFELQKHYDFEEVLLNDINIELIAAYKAVQTDVNLLMSILSEMKESYLKLNDEMRSEYYYNVRNDFNVENVKVKNNHYDILKKIDSGKCFEHVAKLIFLNKTCFNGLYRLNKKGEFNVPFGKYKNPAIYDENLISVSEALQDVTLTCGEYYDIEKYVELDIDTFVYMDPPYRPLPNTSSFTSYSKSDFNEDNQIELSQWFRKIDKTGALLMLSNSDPKNADPDDSFFEDHFNDFKIEKVYAARAINSKSDARGKISELVIKNY